MAGETNYGACPQRIGNPLIYPRRIFLILLNSFFAQDQLVSFPNAPENRYKVICNSDGSIDYDRSGVTINDSFDKTIANARPQVVISRGQSSWQDVGMGDQAGQSFRGSGRSSFHDVFTVPIQFSIYSANDIEAEELAWSVAFFIKLFEIEIRKGTVIQQVTSAFIGPVVPAKVDSEVDLFQIDIQTTVTMPVNWIKTSTLSLDDIKNGFCNLSGDEFPKFLKDLCVTAEPKDPPSTWKA